MAVNITQDLYDQLVDAYRDKPGNVSNARRETSAGQTTARRAWDKGWPTLGLVPIKAVLHEEAMVARGQIEAARLARNASEKLAKEDAKKNAIQARQQEGQVVQLTRANALQSMAVVVALGRSARDFSKVITERLEHEKTKVSLQTQYEKDLMAGLAPEHPNVGKASMSLESLVNLLNRVADYSQKITHCSRQAMEMERLHLGQPTDIIGVADASLDDSVGREELDTRIHSALQALNHAREAGGLKVITGGKIEPSIGKRVYVR